MTVDTPASCIVFPYCLSNADGVKAAIGLRLTPRRQLVERYILVDAYVARQTEHALRDDVSQDLVSASGNPPAGGGQPEFLPTAFHEGACWVANDAGHILQI